MTGWVLGCHRSGTSLLCSILRNLSPAHRERPLGPDLPASPDNPAGFHESASLVKVNDQLLGWAGCTWDRPFVIRPAWADPGSLELIARLQLPLAKHITNVGWIDKDPRLCLTRDAFTHILLRDPAAIAVMRDPLAVATSLHRRNGFSLRKGAAIWLLYNLHLFNSRSRPPETLVLFDDLVSPEREVQKRVARELAAFSVAASAETAVTSVGALERQALSELNSALRRDLVRSEDYRRDETDGQLAHTLEEIWSGCREIVRSCAGHHKMASHLRSAWASVSPVLEPAVAIPLRESQSRGERLGKSVRAVRGQFMPSVRRRLRADLTRPSVQSRQWLGD
jgi:hypothetical protein